MVVIGPQAIWLSSERSGLWTMGGSPQPNMARPSRIGNYSTPVGGLIEFQGPCPSLIRSIEGVMDFTLQSYLASPRKFGNNIFPVGGMIESHDMLIRSLLLIRMAWSCRGKHGWRSIYTICSQLLVDCNATLGICGGICREFFTKNVLLLYLHHFGSENFDWTRLSTNFLFIV